MADSIKVSTDNLTECAMRYTAIAAEFDKTASEIIDKYRSFENHWCGDFTQDLDSTINNFRVSSRTIFENCNSLAAFINEAVQKYISVDRGLIPASEVSGKDYPAGVEVPYAGQNSFPINLDAFSDVSNTWFQRHYVKEDGTLSTGNCTWYVDSRWTDRNPNKPLVFNEGVRDAKAWDNLINKDYFNVNSTSDISNIVPNSIGVDDAGYSGYGHVVYVEKVENGRVYYTEDGDKIRKKGVLMDMDISKFASVYEHIITSK